MMLDSSLNSKHDAFVGRPGSAELPVLADELQLVGRALGVTTTAEVFVVETKTWTIAYHGPIDDSFAQKKNKKANLTAALNAVLEGKPVPVAEAAVKGTPVDFPDRQHAAEFAKIDYATQVAPILPTSASLPHAGRTRAVRDEQLRHRQRLLADDPRSAADQAHASVPFGSPWRGLDRRHASVGRADQDDRQLGRGRRAARRRSGSAARSSEAGAEVAARRARCQSCRFRPFNVPGDGIVAIRTVRCRRS
jgi:hypothetical protein